MLRELRYNPTVEWLLGLWLISGCMERGAWIVALGFFGILSLVSLSLGLTGQPSCGCFGAIQVHPWWTFALDVLILGMLSWRVPTQTWDEGYRQLPVLIYHFGATTALVSSGLLFIVWYFGSWHTALVLLRGEVLSLEPAVIQLPPASAGTTSQMLVRITNHGRIPITLVGGTTNCRCVTTGQMPLTLAAGSEVDMPIQLTYTGEAGRFYHHFQLHTTSPTQPVVVGGVLGWVSGPPPS
jgi:hypothetical protein